MPHAGVLYTWAQHSASLPHLPDVWFAMADMARTASVRHITVLQGVMMSCVPGFGCCLRCQQRFQSKARYAFTRKSDKPLQETLQLGVLSFSVM